jgi:hypothetical protein
MSPWRRSAPPPDLTYTEEPRPAMVRLLFFWRINAA